MARRAAAVSTALLTLAAQSGTSVAATPAWAWPLDGAGPASVVRPFDPPATRYAAGHRGVDLSGAPGAAVRSAGDGRVSYAGLLAGRGVVVVVHGDLRTTYEPVTTAVGVGARVGAGDVLGALSAGHAGCPAAACLHWGLRRGDTYLDPLALLATGPVRLLPLGAGPTDPAVEQPGRAPAVRSSPAGGQEPVEQPPLRRTAGTGGAVGAGAWLAAVLLLALALLRGARGPRPRPGGSAAARAAPPGHDELAHRRRTRTGAGLRRAAGQDLAA